MTGLAMREELDLTCPRSHDPARCVSLGLHADAMQSGARLGSGDAGRACGLRGACSTVWGRLGLAGLERQSVCIGGGVLNHYYIQMNRNGSAEVLPRLYLESYKDRKSRERETGTQKLEPEETPPKRSGISIRFEKRLFRSTLRPPS